MSDKAVNREICDRLHEVYGCLRAQQRKHVEKMEFWSESNSLHDYHEGAARALEYAANVLGHELLDLFDNSGVWGCEDAED